MPLIYFKDISVHVAFNEDSLHCSLGLGLSLVCDIGH